MMRILKRAIRRLDTFTSGWPQQHVGSQDVSTWCQCNAGVFMLESSCWYDQDVGFIMLWICWFGILGLCHDLGSWECGMMSDLCGMIWDFLGKWNELGLITWECGLFGNVDYLGMWNALASIGICGMGL